MQDGHASSAHPALPVLPVVPLERRGTRSLGGKSPGVHGSGSDKSCPAEVTSACQHHAEQFMSVVLFNPQENFDRWALSHFTGEEMEAQRV